MRSVLGRRGGLITRVLAIGAVILGLLALFEQPVFDLGPLKEVALAAILLGVAQLL